MSDYYNEMLQKGLEFQDYVIDKLIGSMGICISNYSSKKFQYNVGENKQGIEIKYDMKHIETGNLYIEVKEKTNSNNLNYIDSGIFREDNSWLYIIGNHDVLYIFSIKCLQQLSFKKSIIEIKKGTSKGFLLTKEEAEFYSIKIIK